jgi:WD40 repeat protein
MNSHGLSSLLFRWEQACAQGHDLPAEQLCPDRPEVAAELARCIDSLRRMRALTSQTAVEAPGPLAPPLTAEVHTGDVLPTVAPSRAPDAGAGAAAWPMAPPSLAGFEIDVPATVAPRQGRARPSTAASSPPGYEILAELGRGGMGVVYKATQVGLNRVVALKMILAGAHAGGERTRFRTEAEAIARLQHPGIVQVFEVGEHDGLPFLALEFCPGGSLEQKLNGTPLPPARAAALVEPLARAVDAAHRKGVVHRDLKPANVLLAGEPGPVRAGSATPAGADGTGLAGLVPKITDFGLAKFVGEAGQTGTGAVMGTPSYMAPEQAEGKSKEIGPAADVYALGAVLYECLTGRPPFRAATAFETIVQVLNEEPVPPRQLNAGVAKDLETVCLKCLRKEPDKRYVSAADLADDVARWLAGEPIHARPVGPGERVGRWCRRNPVVTGLLATVVLSLLIGLAGVLHFAIRANEARTAAEDAATKEAQARHREQQRAAELRLGLVRQHIASGTRLLETGERGQGLWEYAHAWQLAPRRAEEDSHRLRLGLTLQTGPQLVGVCFHRRPVLDAVFAPDGRTILTRTDESRAYLWGPFQGRLVAPPLDHAREVLAVAFSPSGAQVATGSADGTVRFWDAGSGRLRRVLPQSGPVLSLAYRSAGDLLAVATQTGQVHFWGPRTGQGAAPPLKRPAAVYHVAFSRDGQRLVTADAGHTAQVWEVATGKALTGPLPHRDYRAENHTAINYRRWPVFSPDGSALATVAQLPGREATLMVWDLSTGKQRYPGTKAGLKLHRVRFSPDGSRLIGSCGNVVNIYAADTGKWLTSLPHPRESQHSCVSLDGKRLATCSTGGLIHLWDLGSRKETDQPLRCADGVHSLTFSRDGQLLLAASHDGTARVWRLASAGHPRPYTFACGRAHRFNWADGDERVRPSPDGRREVRLGPAGVRLRNPGGGAEVRLDHPASVRIARFSSDGRRLLTQDSKGTVRWWDAATGRKAAPSLSLRAILFDLGISANGRRLLTVEGRPTARVVTVWDVQSGRKLLGPLREWDTGPQRFNIRALHGKISRAALSPDGTRLVLASDATGTLGVWDVDGGRERGRVRGYRGVLTGIEFSGDGERFLTYGSDTVARLWQTATCEPVGPPLRHPRFCRQADLAPDGRRVVTVDFDRVIRLWDGRSGDLLGRLPRPQSAQLRFGRDGRSLVFSEGSLRVLDLTAYDGSLDDLPPLLRLLTGLHRDPDGSIGPVDQQTFLADPDPHRRAWQAWRREAEHPVSERGN